MTDNKNLAPRQPLSLEAYEALHPDLEVDRDQIGHVWIFARPGANRGGIGMISMYPVGQPDGRTGIGISATRERGSREYTYVRFFADRPEELQACGSAGFDHEEVVRMARDGIELFDGFLSMTPEDQRLVELTGRVSDGMDSVQGLISTLGESGLHISAADGPVLLDAHAAWHTVFPA